MKPIEKRVGDLERHGLKQGELGENGASGRRIEERGAERVEREERTVGGGAQRGGGTIEQRGFTGGPGGAEESEPCRIRAGVVGERSRFQMFENTRQQRRVRIPNEVGAQELDDGGVERTGK